MRPELLVLALALKATAVLVIATIVNSFLQKQSAAHRHLVWSLAFGGLLLLAISAPLASLGSKANLPSVTVNVLAASTSISARSVDWGLPLSVIYALGFCVAMLRLSFDILAAQRVSRRAEHVAGDLWAVPEPIAPAVWAGRILIPQEFLTWPEQRRNAILLHERAHIARADHWTSLFARFTAILYWPIPLVWYALRRLRSEQELACDDAVVQAGVPASQYAEDLLSISGELRPVFAAPGATDGLSARLHFLLIAGQSRRRLSLRVVQASVVLGFAALLPLVLLRAQDDKVSRASHGSTPPKVIVKVEPSYTLEAKDAKISGTVVLSVEIDQNGQVRDVRVLKGIDAGLDQNAANAVRQWQFEPATKDGKPVTVAVTIEVKFKLQ